MRANSFLTTILVLFYYIFITFDFLYFYISLTFFIFWGSAGGTWIGVWGGGGGGIHLNESKLLFNYYSFFYFIISLLRLTFYIFIFR